MRHEHRAGEKLFVDYAGQTVAITDRLTGEIRKAQIFVAVLGASNYITSLCFAFKLFVWAASACNLMPSAPITLRIVSNAGLRSPDSAL